MSKHLVKVVIVDDADTIRSVLRLMLSKEGYEVVGQYSTGNNLTSKLKALQADIVCLDYNLPDVNGLELLKDIRKTCPAVAVVMITGDQSENLKNQAIKAGASGFINKPFTEESICSEIRQVSQAQKLLAAEFKKITNTNNSKPRATAVIADDSQTMRSLLSAILIQANIEIVGEASDGEHAVELFETHEPDLICLDIEMPVMDGLDAFKKIHSKYPKVKALIISSSADKDVVIHAIKLGAKGYIVKPYQPSQVIEVVSKLLT